MSSPKQRLEKLLLQAGVVGLEQTTPASEEAIYLIEADGPVSLELRAEDVSVSTLVYLIGDPEKEICWDAIAEFNAFYLRGGGYQLTLDGEAAVIVTQKMTLAQLEATGLGVYLEDFISRSGTCSCWYMEQVAAD
jgi:hypothetical protein